MGKILGVLYGFMGLIFLPFFALMTVAGSQMPANQRTGMMAFGIGFALALPIISAVMGFIFGVIGAGLYNLVAGWIGGIEVDVE